jgi:beta-lactamase regulating signal transducer with metallopeptidase domain
MAIGDLFGWTMLLDVLARITLVLAAAIVVTLLARRSAAVRHTILVSSLLAVAVIPATTLVVGRTPILQWRVSLASPSTSHAGGNSLRSSDSLWHQSHESAASEDAPVDRSNWSDDLAESATAGSWPIESGRRTSATSLGWRLFLNILLLIAVVGFAVRAAGLVTSLFRLARLVADGRAVGAKFAHVIARARAVTGRLPSPAVLESPCVRAPVAAGVFGPFVLLPSGWSDRLSEDEFMSVLCHEFAHLERHDHRVVVLQEVIACVLWFHPLVHLLNRMLNQAREELCDSHAIRAVDRTTYCTTLLHLATASRPPVMLGASSMWTNRWSLESRVRRILDEDRLIERADNRRASAFIALAVFVGFVLVAVPQLQAAPENAPSGSPRGDNGAPSGSISSQGGISRRTITRSFPASADTLLQFENLAGRVDLVPGNQSSVEIEAVIQIGGLDDATATRLIGAIEWVQVPKPDGTARWGLSFPAQQFPEVRVAGASGLSTDVQTIRYLDQPIRLTTDPRATSPSVAFDLRITLPPETHVVIENAAGSVNARGIVSPLELKTVLGSISLEDITGPLTVESVHGDIGISGPHAEAALRTQTGRISVSGTKEGRIAMATVTGSCQIVHPRDIGIKLQHSGRNSIVVRGLDGCQRLTAESQGTRVELLSRGEGGPSFTVSAGSGDSLIEAAP